jgi:hypothetical protein
MIGATYHQCQHSCRHQARRWYQKADEDGQRVAEVASGLFPRGREGNPGILGQETSMARGKDDVAESEPGRMVFGQTTAEVGL